MTHQLRLTPSAAQLRKAASLLDEVPSERSYKWASPGGRDFLAYVAELASKGCAIAWLAEELSLDTQQLYVALGRHRKRIA